MARKQPPSLTRLMAALGLLFLLAPAALRADGGEKSWEVGKNLIMEATWKNGLQFESPDRAFKFTVGGVVQFDMGWFGADKSVVRSVGVFNNLVDPNQTLQDGMDFRRARI